MADGFLGRWSRRKADAREGKPLDEPAPVAAPIAPGPAASASAPVTPPPATLPADEQRAPQAQAAKGPAEQPVLTLDDVQGLTKESDFKPFVARHVAPEVRNAAMKKLFTDPHFNVMDRMDVYIDDYNLTTPMPESVLRQLASAKFLGMFGDEEKKEDPNTPPGHSTGEAADADVAQDVAQSGVCNEIPSQPPASQETHAHDADLRLQPDDAARPPGAGRAAS
ncbi:DUF3306 domain-containing protein [Variovorax sp. VNK109]|uniref:DUF3306 domain-containing protein n=1 Tax=Variovorax sp. VNK109 TaxID=3400919 RepID=UPI003C089B94